VPSARPSPHLTQTPTEFLITQVPGKPPPYPRCVSSEPSAIQSPPGSMHQAHAIYSPGSRVPMPYQSLTTSVIYKPNGLQQQDGSLSKQGRPPPNYPINCATTKPYMKSLSSERLGSGNVEERNYVVVNNRRVISGPALTQGNFRVPPDSTVETETVTGNRPNATVVSPSEDRSRLTRKKFAQKDIQYIQKKVGDACNSYDASMFMSAFNEAWQQFQANASNYEEDSEVKNSSVIVGQLSDQLQQQSQLVSTKPKVWAPKLSSCSAEPGDGSPRSPTFPPQALPSQPLHSPTQQQYILQQVPNNHYVYSVQSGVGNSPPPPPLVQSKASLSPQTPASGNLALVQSRPTAVQNVPKPPMVQNVPKPAMVQNVPKPAMVQNIPKPAMIQNIPKPAMVQNIPKNIPKPASKAPPQMVVNHFRTRLPVQQQQQQQQLKTNPLPAKRKPRKKCSRCGKEASYICSGCTKEWYCDKECQVSGRLGLLFST